MKTIWAILGLTMMLSFGCEPPQTTQEDHLTKVMLGEKEAIVAGEKSALHWVRQTGEGKLKHSVFKGASVTARQKFVQTPQIRLLPTGNYALKGGKKLVIEGGVERYETWPQRGFLFWSDMDGIFFGELLEDDCPPITVEVSSTGIKRDGRSLGTSSYIECEKTEQDEDGNWLVTKRVGSLTAVSDTGTVVVILDNFRMKNPPCCNLSFSDCCATLGSAGRMGADPTGVSGYHILHQFAAGAVCVEERCQSLIVHDCASGKTYCFDALVSELRLDVYESGWFTVSVPDANANLPVMTECPN
jgi:hypothetical protein